MNRDHIMEPLLVYGSDHRGYELRKQIDEAIDNNNPRQFATVDCGTHHPTESTDYPLFAHSVTSHMRWAEDTDNWPDNRTAFGILVCGSGFGVAIAANKTEGIRAVTCRSIQDAVMARKHNDANVVCIGADVTALALAVQIVEAFINTEFEGGRHQNRIDMMELKKPTNSIPPTTMPFK